MAEQTCACGMPLDSQEIKCPCDETKCRYCCECPSNCSCECNKEEEVLDIEPEE